MQRPLTLVYRPPGGCEPHQNNSETPRNEKQQAITSSTPPRPPRQVSCREKRPMEQVRWAAPGSHNFSIAIHAAYAPPVPPAPPLPPMPPAPPMPPVPPPPTQTADWAVHLNGSQNMPVLTDPYAPPQNSSSSKGPVNYQFVNRQWIETQSVNEFTTFCSQQSNRGYQPPSNVTFVRVPLGTNASSRVICNAPSAASGAVSNTSCAPVIAASEFSGPVSSIPMPPPPPRIPPPPPQSEFLRPPRPPPPPLPPPPDQAWNALASTPFAVGNQNVCSPGEVFCDVCEKVFSSKQRLDYHISEEHLPCDVAGCTFSAPFMFLQAHKLKHITIQGSGVAVLDDPNEIKKWRESRRANFPRRGTNAISKPRPVPKSAIERLLRSQYETALGRSTLARRLQQHSSGLLPSLRNILKRRRRPVKISQPGQSGQQQRKGHSEFNVTQLLNEFPICEHFLRTRSCRWGDECRQSHDIGAYKRWTALRNQKGLDIPLRAPVVYQLLLPEIKEAETQVILALRYIVDENFFGRESGTLQIEKKAPEDLTDSTKVSQGTVPGSLPLTNEHHLFGIEGNADTESSESDEEDAQEICDALHSYNEPYEEVISHDSTAFEEGEVLF